MGRSQCKEGKYGQTYSKKVTFRGKFNDMKELSKGTMENGLGEDLTESRSAQTQTFE